MDPFSQPCSFQNLLNSQQPNTSFSFVSRQPSIELYASDASVFATQWHEDANEDAHIVSDCKERRKWSPVEDVVLISAWLNTPKDPVTGNEQKAIAFGNGLLHILHQVQNFRFTLEHAWLELRHDQKWCGASGTKDKVSSKRRKLDDQSAQSSSFVPGCQGEDEAMTRHVGVKAAKARGKSKVKASEKEVKPLVEFQSIWEIRQKDFVLKEKLNKQKLLDSLIAKTEPLSELEIALKNKLINDMLLYCEKEKLSDDQFLVTYQQVMIVERRHVT
ncbi:glutathione S-transferase T2-like [Brassica napus]|uniref:glutathione S-transferase T2-like n=1 Tax=Brassica napus TaxID=3708 RepID=UPI002079C310|nr:glutathione S-transferase T2-like [Brassica napus]